MGTVVIADMVVIIMFAAASALAQNATGGGADVMEMLGTLAWELFGSIGIGLVVGVLIAAYMRSNAGSSALFVAAVSFVVAEVGQRVHLDPLLVMLAAGILIRNATRAADTLHHGIEAAALPVYVAFFAVAGATIHLGAIVTMAVPALIVIAVRSTGLVLGSRVAASVADAPEAVKRFSGFGLLPQAGLALALALIFSRTFPQFGAEASALVFGVVALNELLAPIAFRIALIRSGEAGKRHAPPAVASEATVPDPEIAPETAPEPAV
jgi:Kef-type K+ transport system membrane component KefB